MLKINDILKKLKIEDYETIKSDENKTVVRLKINDKSKILKVYNNSDNLIEIEIYKILSKLNVSALVVSEIGENYILIEDINSLKNYRVAKESDLKNNEVLKAIAKWYRQLHNESRAYLIKNPSKAIESSINKLTAKNIDMLARKTNYNNFEFWESLKSNLQLIRKTYNENICIVYWDFYYKNLVVSTDLKEAFFFDYDCSVIAIPSFDVSIVMENIEKSDSFMEEYGQIEETEKKLAQFLRPIINLIEGYEYASNNNCEVAKWIKPIEEKLHSNKIANDYFNFLKAVTIES